MERLPFRCRDSHAPNLPVRASVGGVPCIGRRTFVRGAGAGLLLAGLSALPSCGDEPPLVIGVHESWIGHQPLLAEHARRSPKSGPIVLERLTGLSAAQQRFRSGALNALFGTLDEAIRLLAEGMDLRILLVSEESAGADAVVAQPQFADMRALRGRRIGLMSIGIEGYLLARALELNGMSADDVALVPMEGDRLAAAFREARVDAVVTWYPLITDLLHVGGHVVFDSGSVDEDILGVMVAKRSVASSNSEAFGGFLDLWSAAVRRLRGAPDQLIAEIADRTRGQPAALRSALDSVVLYDSPESLELLLGQDRPLLKLADRLQGNMLRLGLLNTRQNLTTLVEPALLRGLYAEWAEA